METPDPPSELSLNKFSSSVISDDKFRKSFGAIKHRKRQRPEFRPVKTQQTPIQKKQVVDKQSLYFRVRIISKVGVFIEKLKSFVTLSQPNFKHQQMEYIQNNQAQENNDDYLFSPYSKLIVAFQVVVSILSIISVWNSSFGVVFLEINMVPFTLRLTSIVVFALEILVNFNLKLPPDLNQEKMVEDRTSVMKNNLKNKLPYDLISLTSLILCQFLSENTWIIIVARCLVIIKLHSFFAFIKNMRQMFVETANQETYTNLFVLLLQIFMFVHFLSLFLNGMAIIQNNYGQNKTWITQSGVTTNQQIELYLYGWYWGANLLTTVGLGDFIPGNVYECFIVSFVQIFCTAFFGFLMSYIGGMLSVLGEATQVYEKDMRKLNKYLQKVNITHNLKTEIRKQFSYSREITKIQDPQVQQKIISQLPPNMINEMRAGNNTNILMQSIFFKRYTQDILTELATKLRRVIYAPNENVFFKGQTQTKVWIIEKGTIIELYNKQQNNEQKIIAQYNPQSSHPGYINFITDQHFTTFGKSKGFTWTYELKRSAMVQLLKLYPVQYYKFCQSKDRMILQGKKYISQCYACGKLSHNTLQCPKIHFKPQLQVYRLPRYIKKQRCQRSSYPRSDERHNSHVIYAIIVQQLMPDKGNSHNNIPSSRGLVNQNNQTGRKRTRISINSDHIRNFQFNHSISKRQQLTLDEQSQVMTNIIKNVQNTEKGQFKLNQHYFPQSSVKSVLDKYKQFVRKK